MTSRKTKKQQEELPSFLLNLDRIPSEIKLSTNKASSDYYLGPIFFGGCFQRHPPHVIPREHLPPAVFTTISEQDIIENVFVEKSAEKKDFKTEESDFKKWFAGKKRKSFKPPVSRPRGVRKAFVPEVGGHEIDFGETESEISGEMCREIPVCRITSCSSTSQHYEMVNLSDISEKNRPYMPYNARIAHSHFLKEFVTVRIIGPKIPASITIKKLPTKRKRLSDLTFHLQSKKDSPGSEKGKKVGGKDVKKETVKEAKNEEDGEEEGDDSVMELMKPVSIAEELDDSLDNVEMETSRSMIKEEGSHEKSIVDEGDDGLVHDEEKDRTSFNSDKQKLEIKQEEEGEVPESDRPAEVLEVMEEE